MKKIFLLFVTFLLFICSNVYAKDLMIEVNINGTGKVLEYKDDGVLISFNEAKRRYNVPNYVAIQYNEETLYFYQGKEIDELTYNNGISEENTDNLIKKYGSFGYRVRNTEEMIDTIKKLYDDRLAGIYHLVYSVHDLASIDFSIVEEFVKSNYVFDSSINTFNYSNHGIISYPKYMYDYDEFEMVVRVNPIISKDQESYVDDFLEVLKNDLENKTVYEKILFTYKYLKDTVQGCDGLSKKGASAYDALISKNASCIGLSNAFQLIMERLGVESYIVDDISVEGDLVISNHTFNVVNLNGEYYIVDLSSNGFEGFLIGNMNNYRLSNGVFISESSYNYEVSNISIDYNKYSKLVDNILVDIQKKEHLKQNKDDLKSIDFFSYIVLIVILLILTIIIIYFTRKDR